MEKSFQKPLFILKLGVLVVLGMWNLDKFVNPAHTAGVYNRYYLIEGLELNLSYVIGFVQLAILIMFTLGIKKRFNYGAVLLMHGISTLSTWEMYLDPWGPKNLLFFAAWPMLAAIWVLYKNREYDKILNIK